MSTNRQIMYLTKLAKELTLNEEECVRFVNEIKDRFEELTTEEASFLIQYLIDQSE